MSRLTQTMAMIAVLAGILMAQVPTGGLVAFYPFTGNLLDASGNGHKLDSLHVTDQRLIPKYVSDRNGVANRADSFPGGTCGLYTPADSFPTGSSARTISAWVKLGFLTEPRTIVSWGDKRTHTECSFLALSRGGFDYLIFTNGPDSLLCRFTSLQRIQSWTHLAVSLSSAGLAKMYMDDSLLVSKQMSSWNTSAGFLGIGAWFGSPGNVQEPWSGCIDAVTIYKRDLSSAEISVLANNVTDLLIPTHVSVPNTVQYSAVKSAGSSTLYTVSGRTLKRAPVAGLLVGENLRKSLRIQ